MDLSLVMCTLCGLHRLYTGKLIPVSGDMTTMSFLFSKEAIVFPIGKNEIFSFCLSKVQNLCPGSIAHEGLWVVPSPVQTASITYLGGSQDKLL